MKKFNIPRSKVVILTKIYNPVMDDDSRPPPVNDGPLVNQMGLSRKHIFEAVDRCLERLQTDYIDVLQLHRLDRRGVRRKPSSDGGQDAARDDSEWEQAHRERADAPREGSSQGDSPQDDQRRASSQS